MDLGTICLKNTLLAPISYFFAWLFKIAAKLFKRVFEHRLDVNKSSLSMKIETNTKVVLS